MSIPNPLRCLALASTTLIPILVSACSPSSAPTAPSPTVSSVAISGTNGAGIAGQTAALVATAAYSDNTTANVTTQATWESSNTTVATVSSAGVVTFLATGIVDIRASFRSVIGTARITVAPPAPTVTAITVTGVGTATTVGSSGTLKATATYSNGTTADVTTQATWTSSNAGVATVSSTGAVSFVAAGEVDLRAGFGGVTGILRVSVSAAPVFHNLDGTVRDSVSNQPIAGVLVVVRDGPNSGRSERTDGSGTYRFSGLVAGSFTLDFSIDGAYSATSKGLTLSEDSRVDILLTPSVGQYYGTFNIAFTVIQDTCEFPAPPDPTARLEFAGQPNGTSLSIKITEPNRGSRTYVSGRMNADGTFSATLPPPTLWPGDALADVIRPFHDVGGTIQGTVSGNAISGTETLVYGAPCPGKLISVRLTGNK